MRTPDYDSSDLIDDKNRLRILAIPNASGHHFVHERDIVYCKAEGNYSHIITLNGKQFTVTKSLRHLMELLNPNFFCRIHQSHIINLLHLINYKNRDKRVVVMRDGKKLPVARARKRELLDRFTTI